MSNPVDVARFGTPLTAAEKRALDAVRRHGTVKEAAAALGRSPKTLEHQLACARARRGVSTTIQLTQDDAA